MKLLYFFSILPVVDLDFELKGVLVFLRCWNNIDLQISLALLAVLPSAFFHYFICLFVFFLPKWGGAQAPRAPPLDLPLITVTDCVKQDNLFFLDLCISLWNLIGYFFAIGWLKPLLSLKNIHFFFLFLIKLSASLTQVYQRKSQHGQLVSGSHSNQRPALRFYSGNISQIHLVMDSVKSTPR